MTNGHYFIFHCDFDIALVKLCLIHGNAVAYQSVMRLPIRAVLGIDILWINSPLPAYRTML